MKSRFGRFIRRSLIGFAIFGLLIGVAYLIVDKPLPEGKEGPEAEKMADDMLAAINIKAWDSLAYLSWSSPRSATEYVWDRKNDYVYAFDSGKVAFLAPSLDKGYCLNADGDKIEGEDGQEAYVKALHHFWNDSFWLVAFTKIRDEGTTRKIVDYGDEGKGLLVTYKTGGVTPGDSYLWFLDNQNRPKGWRIWTHRLPVGGLYFSWENWTALPNGALVATVHSASLFTVQQANVAGGQTLESINRPADLFAPLISYLSAHGKH